VVLQHLGDAYRALKLYGKAREVYDRALEVSPEDSVLRAKRDALPGGGK
jgi:tetratricopeptide (TPR) repeat protein